MYMIDFSENTPSIATTEDLPKFLNIKEIINQGKLLWQNLQGWKNFYRGAKITESKFESMIKGKKERTNTNQLDQLKLKQQ